MVQTKALRPKGFPEWMGNDFFLIGYRVFVRYTNQAGKNLRGLYILKSETDKKKMEFLGNIFTHYNYATTDIHQSTQGDITEISSVKSGFKLHVEVEDEENVPLPQGSPFAGGYRRRRSRPPRPWPPGPRRVTIRQPPAGPPR